MKSRFFMLSGHYQRLGEAPRVSWIACFQEHMLRTKLTKAGKCLRGFSPFVFIVILIVWRLGLRVYYQVRTLFCRHNGQCFGQAVVLLGTRTGKEFDDILPRNVYTHRFQVSEDFFGEIAIPLYTDVPSSVETERMSSSPRWRNKSIGATCALCVVHGSSRACGDELPWT